MPRSSSLLDNSFWWRVSFLFFFLSGFSSLVYQVVWVRMAFTHFGIIPPVLSVVISVFMLGLGLGSWLSAKVAAWWMLQRGWPVLGLYALTEALVGFFAWQVPHFFSWGSQLLLTAGAMNSGTYLVESAGLITLAILPACTCMGATIPIMMCHLSQTENSETSFSYLYLANVFGAMMGTVLTAFVLIELLGFQSTEYIAVAFNLLLALSAGTLAMNLPKLLSCASKQVPSPQTGRESRTERVYRLWILFTTGLVSMGCEVLWTRGFTPILGTTIYAYATVLAIYLLGTGVGSFMYRWQRLHGRIGKSFPVDFLLLGVTLSVYLPMLWNDPRIEESWVGVVGSLLPFCGLLGYLTPRLVDDYSQGVANSAGKAYAVNILGCVIGPLIAGYLLLPTVGSRLGTVVLAGPFWILLLANKPITAHMKRTVALGAGALVMTLVLLLSRSYEEYPPGTDPPRIFHRDYAATVISCGTGWHRRLMVNGVGMTGLSTRTKMMAHLPVMAFPGRPRNALLICFGMGTTYRSLLSWGLRTTAVELIPSVPQVFSFYHPDTEAVMSNPLGTIVIDDGRRFLKRTTERYDIITLDPPPPVEAAGSGLLYSKEFYDLVKSHLAEGGVLQQWWPAGELKIFFAVSNTLRSSFPYVRIFKGEKEMGFHFLASMTPIRLRSRNEFISHMPESAQRDYQEWFPGVNLQTMVTITYDHEIPIDKVIPEGWQAMITDDEPYNEYYFLRRHVAFLRGGPQVAYVK